MKHEGKLNLAIYDIQGKQLSDFHKIIEKGWNLFAISSGGNGQLFLKVSDNSTTKTISIVSAGSGSEVEGSPILDRLGGPVELPVKAACCRKPSLQQRLAEWPGCSWRVLEQYTDQRNRGIVAGFR